VHVSTPLAVIGPMAGYLCRNGDDPPELSRLLDLEAEVLASADLFQANTEAVRETIRDHYEDTCDDERWTVLNIGLRDRAPSAVGGTQSRRTVFFVGRFESRKGVDVLLEAMSRVLPDHPDVDLVLAGEDRPLRPGEPPFGATWLARHADRPWARRVSMVGVVDDDVLHEYYARADLVVLPSRYESFGLVMAEAMMHARPLISTDASGVREVVRNGVDGLLVAPGDVDELETAIRRLLADPDQARALGKAARERFDEHLEIGRVAERFERFWARLDSVRRDAEGRQLPRVVSAGDVAALAVPPGAATVVVRAEEPSRVEIAGADPHGLRLAAGERRRVRIAALGRVMVHVREGTVVVERVVTVGSGPGG
jgi:glycosyltransferase involved in cell wall biosynthesis